MMESQWLLSLGGGMLAGLSALILMLFNGRVAGISGILAGVLQQRAPWRVLFLLGLGAGAWLALTLGWASMPAFTTLPGWPVVVLAGVWLGLFSVNMVLKEASMSRYPEWAAYKKRTWWLVPGLL